MHTDKREYILQIYYHNRLHIYVNLVTNNILSTLREGMFGIRVLSLPQ